MRAALQAFPSLFRVGLSAALAYRSEFLIWILATNMPLVMLLLWTTVASEAPVGRYGEKEFVAYFLATLIVRLSTGSWVVWEMNFEIKQGTLAQRLLRPIHPFVSWLADNAAALPMRAMIAFPLTLGALFIVGADAISHDPVQWTVFPISLLGAFALTFSVMLAIGTLGLYFESSIAVFDVYLGLFFVLSGYIVPLDLFPPWLYSVVKWLPFRYTLSFPVETALGLASRGETLLSLGVQWAYVATFTGLSLLLWKRGLKRWSAFGG